MGCLGGALLGRGKETLPRIFVHDDTNAAIIITTHQVMAGADEIRMHMRAYTRFKRR